MARPVRAQSLSRTSPYLRRLAQSLIWAATVGTLGWLLGLAPIWQVWVLVIACMLLGFMKTQAADAVTRWMERGVRLAIWGAVFLALCWLLGLVPTWPLFALALVGTLADFVLGRLLPAAPRG